MCLSCDQGDQLGGHLTSLALRCCWRFGLWSGRVVSLLFLCFYLLVDGVDTYAGALGRR
jgi:hypothetical protein